MTSKDSTAAPANSDELDEVLTQPSESVIEAVANTNGDFAVLGAGGKMGFHVSRMLQRSLEKLGRSDRLLCVSRFGSRDAKIAFDRAGLETMSADLSVAKQVAELPKIANVFYLAGVKFGTSSQPEMLRRMNVVMPQLVAEHFCDSTIVALSTGCVYSFTTPESGGSSETDETDPPGEYARSCLGREAAFIEGSKRYGTPCTLVRLNYAIDLRYGVLIDLAQQIVADRSVDVSTGYVNVIWQGDAVAHILQCLRIASSPPCAINITGPDVLSTRHLAKGLAERLGKQVTFVGDEADTAWLSNAALSHKLFSSPRVDVAQMMDWVADWIARGGETLGKPTHFENRRGTY